ncbi:putative transcription factor bHLH family [Lupinus albus]|uniref:Putative transcription factor bHLH family n=1 Tax=Lupinus albus TaxID=3870 RepID=A0A6A4PLS0_LUPAL|nr:putative transcription factor bHLH family [Lupinus albus]
MGNSRSVKQEFLRKWIKGFRKYSSQKKNMNMVERKKAIKLSADIAMASTRNKTKRWSQVLIANASRDGNNKLLTENILDSSPQNSEKMVRKNLINLSPLCSKRVRSRKVLRRNRTMIHKSSKENLMASSIAKRLTIQKRTRRLKSLLPGGEFMDGVSLVEETLDYIESLRAQVEVMRCLVTASELFINPS